MHRHSPVAAGQAIAVGVGTHPRRHDDGQVLGGVSMKARHDTREKDGDGGTRSLWNSSCFCTAHRVALGVSLSAVAYSAHSMLLCSPVRFRPFPTEKGGARN